ncbi:MAG TPA: hypothetical protein VLM18_09105 [Croceibacterium sp.]|nr:hypothetical protein [Croceibacterium sp.]
MSATTGAAERLDDAIAAALRLDREACVARARQFSWRASADRFLAALVPESRDGSLPKAA